MVRLVNKKTTKNINKSTAKKTNGVRQNGHILKQNMLLVNNYMLRWILLQAIVNIEVSKNMRKNK